MILFTSISSRLLHTAFRSPRFRKKGQRVLLFWGKAKSPSVNITISLRALSFLLYQKSDILYFKTVIYLPGSATFSWSRNARIFSYVQSPNTGNYKVCCFRLSLLFPWPVRFRLPPPHTHTFTSLFIHLGVPGTFKSTPALLWWIAIGSEPWATLKRYLFLFSYCPKILTDSSGPAHEVWGSVVK